MKTVPDIFSPHGRRLSFNVRDDTNDDALVHGILLTDEYRLRDLRHLEGWALDIGAHIGTVAIALAADHPDLRIIAVEPVPENAEILRSNIALNGFTDRVFVEEAGAAATSRSKVRCHYGLTVGDKGDARYVEQNRYIGNIWRGSDPGEAFVAARPVTIRSLAQQYGVTDFRLCKIDCEGCEWSFLRRDAGLISEIVGEWHDLEFADIAAMLAPTHTAKIVTDNHGSGIFRAFRHIR